MRYVNNINIYAGNPGLFFCAKNPTLHCAGLHLIFAVNYSCEQAARECSCSVIYEPYRLQLAAALLVRMVLSAVTLYFRFFP